MEVEAWKYTGWCVGINVINLQAGTFIFPWSIRPGATANPPNEEIWGTEHKLTFTGRPADCYFLSPAQGYPLNAECVVTLHGKKGFFRANIKEPSLMLMPHQMSTGAEYISQLISNLTRVLRVYTAIKIAASHTVSCGFPSAVVCGRIVSRVPFLEHGKLLSQTFDYTAPPLLLCLLSMSYCLHAEMKD